ncbi:MAG TPA: DUF4124 domain-containing protein [Xanthomonadales bacterium]|nr:DUF4124 domain-containing protein [Xanthomonadales bacterium]
MLKGFCTFLIVALLIATIPDVAAQVYRCETASGVVYADFPCGEAAEEIVVDVVEPAVQETPEVADESSGLAGSVTDDSISTDAAAEGATEVPPPVQEVTTLNEFSKMLVTQRETQISEIDRNLLELRARVNSEEFRTADSTTQARMMLEIRELEASRDSIMEQYATLIAEAQSRAE